MKKFHQCILLTIFFVSGCMSEEKPDVAKSKTMEADLPTLMSACNETFIIEMQYLDEMNKSGSFPDETDRTPKCYVRCLLEKSGIATTDGKYDVERTAMVLPANKIGRPVEEVKAIAMGCSKREESCLCDRAYQYMKCIIEAEIAKFDNA